MSEEMAEADHLAPIRRQLLEHALPHIPFDGWSRISLAKAAQECGMDEGTAELAFPGGPAELLDFFAQQADAEMEARLAAMNLSDMRIRDRIKAAVTARIEAIAGHKEAERRALSFLALPLNAGLGPKLVARTVDAMWRAAGDTSTDFNFYTKRFLLAGVYGATLLYWLNDGSEGHTATWAFLDRRIEDVMQIEKAKARLREATEKWPSPVAFLGRLRYPGETRMKP